MASILKRISEGYPKLVLILSGRTCNAIYQNSDEAHIFCSVLPFQQAPSVVCTTNRSQVIADFVKTVGRKVYTLTTLLRYA